MNALEGSYRVLLKARAKVSEGESEPEGADTPGNCWLRRMCSRKNLAQSMSCLLLQFFLHGTARPPHLSPSTAPPQRKESSTTRKKEEVKATPSKRRGVAAPPKEGGRKAAPLPFWLQGLYLAPAVRLTPFSGDVPRSKI